MSEQQYIANKQQFKPGKDELITALASFVSGYLYIEGVYTSYALSMRILTVAIIIIVSTWYLNRDKKLNPEKIIWLACFLMLAISYTFPISGVFEDWQLFLLLHLAAGQFVLSFSEVQLQKRFDTYIALDAFHILVNIPFSNFVLRSRTLIYFLKHTFAKKEKKEVNSIQVLVPVVVVFLFVLALRYLCDADDNFGQFFGNLFSHLLLDTNVFEKILLVIFSIPVGGYLCGMINGSYRLNQEKLDCEKENLDKLIVGSGKMEDKFWNGTTILFTLLYLSFFIFQFTYLFGAFSGSAPQNMLISEYARQGFFELCKIMAINFILLLLASVTTLIEKKGKAFKIAQLVLLGQSILFAITALSKLILYIVTFGFTPLRLQSFWLILVLLAGCICWIIHLLNKKELFRIWGIVSLITLCLLSCLPIF